MGITAYTTSVQNQNKAGEQYAAALPKMPGYCFDKDIPFAAMRTPQDQIHWLYKHLLMLPSVEDYSALAELIKGLSEENDALTEAMNDLLTRLKAAEAMIAGLAEQSMCYDVTRGVYRPSITVERRVWQAEAPYGYTVEDMAGMTVGECSTLTCIELAKFARTSRDGQTLPRDVIAEQGGYETPRFNPSDYIRRDELELIEVSNLQDHDIYGLPDTSLSAPVPKPAALIRKANVTDLNESYVLWNKHLISENDEVY